ncbi:RING-type E3 ubiquitin-protein ligase ppil2 [Blyttiomyces sp. JEL0837]|nr:RING-type E3 ubiquitin-protein ligase ppil2 [Blyttiomyces sp. JEL0837]
MGKDTDKMYIVEWSTLDFGHGGYKGKKTGREFKRLPFFCCALSLTPFESPRCTRAGHVFDLINIIPWLKKHGTNPITGEKLASKDLITLHFHKNAEGSYHDPITYKVFTENTHIVAIATSGYVYAYETIDELNIKTKSWRDLMSDEPFKRSDIITLQDPHKLGDRDINQFHYKKNEMEVPSAQTNPDDARKQQLLNKINAKGATARILAEMAPKTAEKGTASASTTSVTPSFVEKKSKTYNAAHYSNNEAAASFTSLGAVAVTRNTSATISDEEYLFKNCKEKGYVAMKTNFGTIQLELYCADAPRACYNFIMLAKQDYYKDVIFHRVIKNFMMQAGDPTGTGRGGKSYYGKPFADEFKASLSHDARGILSCANHGPNTNQSQFFITFRACKHLDNKHTVFGKVIDGLDILATVEKIPTGDDDRPRVPVKIEDVKVLVDPFERLLAEARGEDEVTRKKAQQASLKKAQEVAAEKRLESKVASGNSVGKYLDLTKLSGEKRPSESAALAEHDVEEARPIKKKPKGGFGDFSSW